MNVVIIDDEKMAIDVMSIMLKKLTKFSICIKGAFTNTTDAFECIAQEKVDVLFLDMEMIDIHGLQVANKITAEYPNIQIIFVTAHAQFAIDAFDIEATDYLLKPVHEKRLVKALTKAEQIVNISEDTQFVRKERNMFAHTFGSFHLLDAGQEIMKWRTRKVRELFLYLWFHQKRPILNAVIMEELWPKLEFEKAAANLHTSIYQLRKLFRENSDENPVLLVNNHYQLNISIDSDFEELTQLLARPQHDEQSIQQLLNCYEGDFLVEEEYDWAIQIRLRIKQEVLLLLEDYIVNTININPLLKLNCLQKMLELDEFNENYMLLLLQFLIEQNKKQDCTECYEMIQKKLKGDLGVSIPEEITRVYNTYMMSV